MGSKKDVTSVLKPSLTNKPYKAKPFKLLPLAVISEQELVDLFASDKIKDKYSKVGHFTSNNKINTLNYASNFCEIETLPKRMYKISKSTTPYIPYSLRLLKTSFYNYITPLLLNFLIGEIKSDQPKKIFTKLNTEGLKKSEPKYFFEITATSLAHNIKMINNNYMTIYDFKKLYSQFNNISTRYTSSYFNITWNQLYYYISTCLDTLKYNDILSYEKVTMVITTDEYNSKEHTMADDESIAIRRECQLRVLRFLGVKTLGDFTSDDTACKCSRDRYKYNELMENELSKYNILSFYICYKISLSENNLKKCIGLMSSYSGGKKFKSTISFIKKFNNDFIGNSIDCMEERITNTKKSSTKIPVIEGNGKSKLENSLNSYRSAFRHLAFTTLHINAKEIDLDDINKEMKLRKELKKKNENHKPKEDNSTAKDLGNYSNYEFFTALFTAEGEMDDESLEDLMSIK